MNSNLQVLKKLEDWLSTILPCLGNFPKSARFTLAQKIENTSLECIDLVISASLDKPNRATHILRSRVTAQRLQLLVRVALNRSFIDLRHYEIYSDQLTEISKMLAGWARVTK